MAVELLNYELKWSFRALDNIFKSFYHCRVPHHKYFIEFTAINWFKIGVNGPPQKRGRGLNKITYTMLSSCIAMLLSWLILFFSKHFSTGRPLKRQRRGGKGPEEEWGMEVWVTVALPLHLRSIWGLICLARCLCTLLLLVTFWCHGVTVKWLPSHVAARGGATSGTIRSRRVGARTQEAPAGRNALTLPPPWLPWNRELVEALLTTSQCLCVPGSSQGPARTQGEDRHIHRHSNQKMAARGVTGANLHVVLWPLTRTEIKLSHPWDAVWEFVPWLAWLIWGDRGLTASYCCSPTDKR